QVGRRVTVAGDLVGARPVFHTAWAGGTAYATAALPLADLIEAQLDVGHLAALLACPDSPEALSDGTPYLGVRRVPPEHALVLRDGTRDITSYEPTASLAVSAPRTRPEQAVGGIRDALLDALRTRFDASHHHTETSHGPTGGYTNGTSHQAELGTEFRHHYEQADIFGNESDYHESLHHTPNPHSKNYHPHRPHRFNPDAHSNATEKSKSFPEVHCRTTGIGADLSGGSASATLALLTIGLADSPDTSPRTRSRQNKRIRAITYDDLALHSNHGHQHEMDRARAIVANYPSLYHVIVTANTKDLPYAALGTEPLTDEPGPAIASAARNRHRLAQGGSDHITGHGARQTLDAHPARLADLLMDHRCGHLLRPLSALTRATGLTAHSPALPFTVYRAARHLTRTTYREALEATAAHMLHLSSLPTDAHPGLPGHPSLTALTWCRPGPAARWLTRDALAEAAVRLQHAAIRSTTLPARPGERRAASALHRQAANHHVYEQAISLPDQRLHAPYLDNQVVRACRAVPETLRVQPGARAHVLRAVLAGTGITGLPPGWGTPSHTLHTAMLQAGIRASLGPLLDLFHTSLLAEAGLIKAATVRNALRATAEGKLVTFLDGLTELISTELWLNQLLAHGATRRSIKPLPHQ
ncbi:hypothetical protein LUZ16_29350, partial [Streptomyces albireticuli]|uniref:asparagine synthase-related protein n=1 Tax=Streptomyces albireticuli TaxID=1940 RepID=UPI001E6312A7